MTSTRPLSGCWLINCAGACADRLKQPALGGIRIGCDIGGRLDRVGAEQLSRAGQQRTHLIELLLQRRIGHGLTLPRPCRSHNSPSAAAVGCRYAVPVAIFGRMTARQRLRRATRESSTIPTFSSPFDCTPWVTGGLWPAELSANGSNNDETTRLAAYLKVDLQRIASSANDELRIIARAGLIGSARRTAEARVIDDARARAVRRVESTMRQLRQLTHQASGSHRADLDKTQVMPAITDAQPVERPAAEPTESAAEPESPDDRLQRLLGFVARQEPRLNWAIGDRVDGTTILATDLAHGWIPPGIAVPEGVRLLEPERRTGRAAELIGTTARCLTYAPGGSTSWSADVSATRSSAQPFELPGIEDLGWELGAATHWRDGLPKVVHTLAKAAAAGTGVVDEEVDLLRVHLDTARYQLLAQYPDVDALQLLNCMLVAATLGNVSKDTTAANYHFSWFKKLAR